MHIKRKLEIVNALVGEGYRWPANRVYRDGATLLGTNGHQLLAFTLTDDEASSVDGLHTLDDGAREFKSMSGKDAVAPEMIRGWLAQDGNAWTVSGVALSQFLRAEEYLRCPYCSGCGRRPVAEPDIEEWDDPFDAPRYVDIGGAWMNARLLLGSLAYLPVGDHLTVTTWPSASWLPNGASVTKAEGHILRIAGDGWTLIQMSVAKTEGCEAEVFPLDAVAAVAEAA